MMLRRTLHSVGFRGIIDVAPQVETALRLRKPIVALESTIITHGMPYPQNLETACEVEQIVETNGATPATIAIIDGRIKVGLTKEDLKTLATRTKEEVTKCSRRDLPFMIAQKQCGGTTVAATMIVAQMSGLSIFATGGIGGVHREGHKTMDISADLTELGRTPIAVVCSGVKSILDIPRTLEYLETQGVCVTTFGSESKRFPDFYTRDSGYFVPYNVQTPVDAAQLIKSLQDLKLNSGILIGVPIPEDYAADKKVIDSAIEQAYVEANAQGITGKEVTPFLLAAIAKITHGTSLRANMALIKNNASVAAKISRELSNIKSFSMPAKRSSNTPLVIGGSILDLSLMLIDDMPKTLDGATYLTSAKQSAGGVGRNIAEGIYKLYGSSKFISVVGNDQMGKNLLELIPEPLRTGVSIDETDSTSLCTVVFDKYGDCKLILGNMDIHSKITPLRIEQSAEELANAPLIVLDANLSLPTMETVFKLAKKYKRPVFFEPTDMRIAGKPFLSQLSESIKITSPNLHELRTIVETITKKPIEGSMNISESTATLLQKVKDLLLQIESHFDCIVVTLGHHGVVVNVRGDFKNPLFDSNTGEYKFLTEGVKPETYTTRFYAAPKVENITNVSGAGDSFTSGFITGLLKGLDTEDAIGMGFISARKALEADSAVPKEYFSSEEERTSALEDTLKNISTQVI